MSMIAFVFSDTVIASITWPRKVSLLIIAELALWGLKVPLAFSIRVKTASSYRSCSV